MATEKLRFYISQRGSVELDLEEEDLFADKIWFDNTINGFIADSVQAAIEEIKAEAAAGASPGFSFGKSGNAPTNTWLDRVGNVPSNIVGLPIFLDNGKIFRVAVFNEVSGTYSIGIYEHDGTTYTLLTTVSVTSAKGKVQEGLSVSITKGKQMAAKVVSGSVKNCGVTVIVKGTI